MLDNEEHQGDESVFRREETLKKLVNGKLSFDWRQVGGSMCGWPSAGKLFEDLNFFQRIVTNTDHLSENLYD